jgi:hypothetical protein
MQGIREEQREKKGKDKNREGQRGTERNREEQRGTEKGGRIRIQRNRGNRQN